MKPLFFIFIFLLGLTLTCSAQTPAPTPDADKSSNPNFFVPNGHKPDGSLPQTPLEHLSFDVKVTSLPAGDKQGDTSGEPYGVAHRFLDDIGGSGYGWLRENDENWNSGRWFCLKETPGVVIAPHRRFLKTAMDNNYEYKFWGNFAKYTAYDPRTDERLPVFVLRGYEVIGPAAPLDLKVGTPDRAVEKHSTASSRSDRPIPHPEVD